MSPSNDISFGDNVRILRTAETERLGIADMIGNVYGETTPSESRVDVIGKLTSDYAFKVHFETLNVSYWFAPHMLEFVNHAPGTEVHVHGSPFKSVRQRDGTWKDIPLNAQGKSRLAWLSGLAAWLIVSFIAAGIGGAASIEAGPFYNQLVRPEWAPPSSVFGPVWTVLYALMGIAAWLVWRVGGFRAARTALTLFIVQLALNALWSWLFFGWHRGGLAFVDILLLWLFIAATMVAFWKISRLAGALLVPYLLWVSFAAALNYAVWQLNPQVLG